MSNVHREGGHVTVQHLYVEEYETAQAERREPFTWPQEPTRHAKVKPPKRVRKVIRPEVRRRRKVSWRARRWFPVAAVLAALMTGCQDTAGPEPEVRVSNEAPKSWIVPEAVAP